MIARIRYRYLLLLVIFLDAIYGVSSSAAAAVNSILMPSQINLVVQANGIKKKKDFSGNISWYGPGLNGKKTASGEIFDMNKNTAAHLTLPFGTRVLIEDPKTGKSVIVRVNDRGPFVRTRIMDVTKEGGRRLNLLSRGVAYVNCLIID